MRALAKASGKKWLSWVGIAITAVAAVCTMSRPDVEGFIGPVLAGKLCSGAVVFGALLAALGKGLGDNRQGKPDTGAPDNIRMADGTVKPNERGAET